MATWDDKMWYPKWAKPDLRLCPFNSQHRVSADKYAKHVMKCEQSVARSGRLSTIGSASSNWSSCVSISSLVTDSMTSAMSQLSVSDESKPRADCRSPDSAIDLQTNSSADTTLVEDHSTELTVGSSVKEPPIAIVADNVKTIADLTNGEMGSGDAEEDWNNCNAPHFDLYRGFDGYDKLTDEQIQELAEGFIDIVLLTRFDRSKKTELYRKLCEFRKLDADRRVKAINKLVSAEGISKEIEKIPQEIRKPMVDARDLFKRSSFTVDTLKKPTLVTSEHNSSPNAAANGESVSPIKSEQKVEEQPVATSSATIGDAKPEIDPQLVTSCNSCWASLALTADNIRRVTVLCPTCSGIKFGGYFECQQCKLYGYFAKNQIDQHLNKHFAN